MTFREWRTGTRQVAASTIFVVALLSCGASSAKDPEPGLSGTLSFEEGFTDNVRADPTLTQSAFFSNLGGEATWQRKPRGWIPHRFGGLVRGRMYSDDRFSNRDYAEFGPSLGYDWRLATLTVGYTYSPDRLRVDPATTVDGYADIHNLPIELRSKFGENKRWTALLTVESEWDFYAPPFHERTYFDETVEAGLRCRATERIAPRASVAYSIRDAISQNFDREEVSVLVGFDLYLPADLRMVFRYEKTWRNFLVGYATDPQGGRNNNFGREDDVNHFQTGLDIPLPWVEAMTIRIRYDYRDNVSSRPDRSYTSNEASLGFTYDID